MAKTPNFETTLSKLESIVKQLESEDLPLETALKQFEVGTKHVATCYEALSNAEQIVKKLTVD